MRFLVVGGSGFLGREIARQARHAGHHVAATFHHRPPGGGLGAVLDWQALDVRRRDQVARVVATAGPDVIVNAAYDQGDWASTADGGAHVALAAAAVAARLVHVSSDAVFAGAADAYDETCPPDPTTPYGAAKAAAETAVAAITPSAVIARTSLIIGYGESVHERHVQALAAGTGTGVLFTDDVRCPVHVSDLATALCELAGSPYSGVHHVAGPDAISRHHLGVLIARRDGLDPAALPTGRRAASDVPGPVELRLNCARTCARLATRLRGAHEFLAPALT